MKDNQEQRKASESKHQATASVHIPSPARNVSIPGKCINQTLGPAGTVLITKVDWVHYNLHLSGTEMRHCQDDYRTAMNSAMSLIRTLQILPTVLTASPLPHSLSSSATSSQIPLLNSEGDLDRLRSQTISKLTNVLFRNLRVRYEIDVEALTSGLVVLET